MVVLFTVLYDEDFERIRACLRHGFELKREGGKLLPHKGYA
jgi:hypothetical protein